MINRKLPTIEENKIYIEHGNPLPNLIEGGDEFEADIDDENSPAQYGIVARNLLRYITRGKPVFNDDKGRHYQRGLTLIEKSLDREKDPALIQALRIELQKILIRSYDQLVWDQNKKHKWEGEAEHAEKQFEIFLSHLLSVYPFIDPEENEIVYVPQKYNHQWILIEYQFKKIDISPQSGFLSRLLEDKDRIYAYALEPHPRYPADVISHLILMGTTYPTGQGAELAQLYNFYPGYSVGEAHDMTHVDYWLMRQNDKAVNLAGHSKGAVMAMIVAAKYACKVNRADCLNPTALRMETLNRLNPIWRALDADLRPEINVYAQSGDPVFPLENGFLEGTNIYHVVPAQQVTSSYKSFVPSFIQAAVESHLHHFAGRDDVTIYKGDATAENNSMRRIFFSDIKNAVNIAVFPQKYLSLYVNLSTRGYENFGWPWKAIKDATVFATNVVNWTVGSFFTVVSVSVGAAYSGVKIGIKSLTGYEYDYQKTNLTLQNERLPSVSTLPLGFSQQMKKVSQLNRLMDEVKISDSSQKKFK